MILAWDPGDIRTGFAMFSYDAKRRKADLKMMKICNTKEVYEVLALAEGILKPGETHTFVIENFRADTNDVIGRAQGRKRSEAMFQWSEMETSQMIGALKYAAYRMNQSRVFLQDRRILGPARNWCDLPLPKGHIPDDKAAYIHGCRHMMDRQMIGSVLDVLKFGQERLPT